MPDEHEEQPNARAEAAALRAAGFALCKPDPAEKKPTYPRWPTKSKEPRHFKPGEMIGIICGPLSNGGRPGHALVIVDLDAQKALDLADEHLQPTNMSEGRPGKLRSHRYYLVPLDTIPDKYRSAAEQAAAAAVAAVGHPGPVTKSLRTPDEQEALRFVGTGGQCVCPPSVWRGDDGATEIRAWNGGARGEPAVIPFPELWEAVCRLAQACGCYEPSGVGWPWSQPRPEPPGPPPPSPKVGQRGARSIEARAVAYLAECNPAESGHRGHDATFWAARAAVYGFGLGAANGFRILKDHFNPRCRPEWSDDDLIHKCADAERLPFDKPFGWLRDTPPPAGANGRARRPPPPDDPPGSGADGDRPQLPEIIVTDRQYRDIETDALAALVAANEPPTVFVGNGCGLVELRRPHDQPPFADELTPAAMRRVLSRVATWFELAGRAKDELTHTFPPTELLSSIPAGVEWPGIPPLTAIATYPVFAPGWELVAAPGYHRPSGIYCHLGGLAVPPVPARPTPADVDRARQLVFVDLLGDFPFVDPASCANAAAMLILPTIRHAIDGPTPLGVVDAPTEGTGKTLLVEVMTLATVGEIPEAISPDMSAEEWDKTLLAMLIEGDPIAFFDNANRKLDSGSLASALTARHKRGRLLGSTKTARARVNLSWLLTANNFTSSREIARRVYYSRIDAGVESPATEARAYLHPDLIAWVRGHRGELIWAVLTLVRNWLSRGRPRGAATLGKFEEWATTVGGILDAAGVRGFLGNAEAFRRQVADEMGELREFVQRWYEQFGREPKLSGDLYPIAADCLDTVLTGKDETSRRTQLGKYLNKQRDRVVGGHKITVPRNAQGQEDRDHSGRPRYRLVAAHPRPDTEPPASGEDMGAE